MLPHIAAIKSRLIIPMVLVVLAVTTTFLCLGLDSGKFQRQIQVESNEQLMERGREYYRRNHVDSALMVFNYINDGYSPSLSDAEKRIAILAKNNVGIIYAFEYADYKRGYEALSEAFELADSEGMEATQAVICINIVELLRLYGICLQSENVRDRVNSYLQRGIEKALESKEYRGLASMVINTLEYDMSDIPDDFKAIDNSEIPDTIEGVAYARACLKAANAHRNGEFSRARAILEHAYKTLPQFSRPGVKDLGFRMAIAKTYAAEGVCNEAERIGNEVAAKADSLGMLQNRLIALDFLSRLPEVDKEKYTRLFLVTKDSALSKGQIQMVSEIDFRRSLNMEREKNRRLSAERKRLFWGLGIGLTLLLVFGVLIGLLIVSRRKLKERNAYLYDRIQEQLKDDKHPKPQPESKAEPTLEPQPTETSKYAGSSLSTEKMDEIESQLTALLENPETVCDPELSLATIASRMNINTTYVSRVVNERFGKSFSALLSEHRVRIATQRMSKDSPYANQTIEAIARSVGYTSRSTFITAFKKINGMTPSEYMKISLA